MPARQRGVRALALCCMRLQGPGGTAGGGHFTSWALPTSTCMQTADSPVRDVQASGAVSATAGAARATLAGVSCAAGACSVLWKPCQACLC